MRAYVFQIYSTSNAGQDTTSYTVEMWNIRLVTTTKSEFSCKLRSVVFSKLPSPSDKLLKSNMLEENDTLSVNY